MIDIEEISRVRKLKGITWNDLSKGLPVTGQALRIAITRGKIQEEYLPIIIENLGLQSEQNIQDTIEHKKTPLKEAGSMEDLLSNAVIEKLKPLLAGVQENHSTMIEGISEMQRQLALVLLDNDELQDHVEDLKEELEFIKRELKRVVR